jgi:hypothetical protein
MSIATFSNQDVQVAACCLTTPVSHSVVVSQPRFRDAHEVRFTYTQLDIPKLTFEFRAPGLVVFPGAPSEHDQIAERLSVSNIGSFNANAFDHRNVLI